MPDMSASLLFLGAAAVLAAMPGPGLLFVAGRSIAGGRPEGYATAAGTGLGGLVHVAAGALGLSALMMASATAFGVLKLVGGLYLIWLAVQTWKSANEPVLGDDSESAGLKRAFRQAAMVEATNPKTAAFFLALIPQFVDPARGSVGIQFMVLGTISVAMNTTMAAIVATTVSSLRQSAMSRPKLIRRLRQGSAGLFAGLGLTLLFARRPA